MMERVVRANYEDGYSVLELIPKSYWQYKFYPPDEYQNCERISVGCYVNGPQRSLCYELFRLSDLPNDFISAQDLEAILSNLHDRTTIKRLERPPNQSCQKSADAG